MQSKFGYLIHRLFDRIIEWREHNIGERYFILIISFIIGIVMALMAACLKKIIHLIEHLLFANSYADSFLYLILPPIGIFITYLFVKYIVRDDIGHGVTKVLLAISQRKGRIKTHNTWSSLLSSSITIGFGGSVGAESPIVLTGAAIGSNAGRLLRLEQRNLMLLIGCGVSAALAGIYKAPIAGMVFVIEVLLLDLTMASILPLLVSSVSAAAMSYIISDEGFLFRFELTEPYRLNNIPYMIALGIICGFMSLFFSQTMFGLESKLKGFAKYRYRYLISAIVLSTLIFLFPPLYGEGYSTINMLLSGQYANILDGSILESFSGSFWIMFLFLFLTILVKVFASTATNSGGGVGGLFAPTLFVGGALGFLFANLMNYLPLKTFLPAKNYVLLGMAGMMAGIMQAPLTGIFLVAELSGGYDLFLPLMLVSMTAFATIRVFMPHSIYSLRLAEQGKLLTHQKDTAVLTLMSLENVLETDFEPVYADMSLGDLIKTISISNRNSFPVIDENRKLIGIIELDNIRNIMFRPDLYDRYNVKKLMISPQIKIYSSMSMTKIMNIFDESKAWKLPVVDDNGVYLGFISKSKIFNNYRDILNDIFIGD